MPGYPCCCTADREECLPCIVIEAESIGDGACGECFDVLNDDWPIQEIRVSGASQAQAVCSLPGSSPSDQCHYEVFTGACVLWWVVGLNSNGGNWDICLHLVGALGSPSAQWQALDVPLPYTFTAADMVHNSHPDGLGCELTEAVMTVREGVCGPCACCAGEEEPSQRAYVRLHNGVTGLGAGCDTECSSLDEHCYELQRTDACTWELASIPEHVDQACFPGFHCVMELLDCNDNPESVTVEVTFSWQGEVHVYRETLDVLPDCTDGRWLFQGVSYIAAESTPSKCAFSGAPLSIGFGPFEGCPDA